MSDEQNIQQAVQQAALITARSALAMVRSAPNHVTAALALEAWVKTLEPEDE